MSFSQQFFNKPLYEITLQDIEMFFQEPQQETSVLEFKAGDVLLEKIFREVAAFLNTEGGLLIIGAPQETKQDNNNICQGKLTPSIHIKSQDRLLQAIAGNITPAPVGLKATTIKGNEGNIFILEIPQSYTPPHQVSNEGKYYIRLEREAKPAPHGIIEALFNQRKRSRVIAKVGPLIKNKSKQPSIHIFLENDSIIHARETGFMLEIFGIKSLNNTANFSTDIQVIDGVLQWHNSNNGLLVKGMKYSIELDITLRMAVFYLHFAFYSADSSMEVIELIFDTEKQTYLHKFYSQNENNDNVMIEDALSTYKQKQREYWANLMGIKYSEQNAEITRTKVYDFMATYKCRIPESLLDFFIISDGYKRTINGRNLIILDIASLEKEVNQEDLFHNNQLTIGFLENFPINLITQDNKIGVFTWTNNYMPATHRDRESTCFYDILEDFITNSDAKATPLFE
jgi:hypothetical protein